MPKKQKELTPEKVQKLGERLNRIIFGAKVQDTEINPELSKKMELPPKTLERKKEGSTHSLASTISGMAQETRTNEHDRYQRYRDYDEMCLAGNTKIKLLNGKSITIQNWAEQYPNDEFDIYAYCVEKGEIVPAVGKNPRITRKDAIMVGVVLSNNKVLEVTPDHKFLLSTGFYKEAQDLKKGDVLQSVSFKMSEKKKDTLEGYEMLNSGNGWEFTHRIARKKKKGKAIHHKDEDKLNNSRSNLKSVPMGKHKEIHEEIEKFGNKHLPLGNNPFLKESVRNNEAKISVKMVTPIKEVYGKVYDIEVATYNNFLLEDGVIVHNCADPLIGGSIETYADEATQRDEADKPLQIEAKDKKTEKMLNELFFDKLRIEDYLWKMAYEMCKFGDTFYEIVFNKKLDDILYLKYVSPYKMFRVEKEGKLKGFEYIHDEKLFLTRREKDVFRIITSNQKYGESIRINPYKIIHFKIDDNKFTPYGRAILDTSRTTWKQLKLLEDAVVVYRLVRAPERRVWYIDTGQLSTDKAIAYTQKVKQMLRKKPIIDPLTGKYSDTKKAISMVEDFWIPVRAGATGNKVDTLGNVQRLGEIDDLQYFRDKMLYYMRIPKAFFTEEGTIQLSGKSLASMDIFFGRAIERIQGFIEKGLYKIAYIYLILQNVKPEKIKSVKINLTSPSIFAQNARMEALSQKFGLVSSIKNTQLFPDVWILKEVMGLADDEIISVMGIMQAQLAGQDIVKLLTGEENPFMQGVGQQPAGGAEGAMTAGLGGAPPATGEMGLGGIEGGVGAGAPEMGAGAGAPPPEGAEGLPTPPPEAGGLELEPTGAGVPAGTAPTISPNDLAVKALLALEGKKISSEDKEKMITEIINNRLTKNKKQYESWKELIGLINERNIRKTEVSNGLTKTVVIGELSGLVDDIHKKRPKDQKAGLITEKQIKEAQMPTNPIIDCQIKEFEKKMSNAYNGDKK